MIDIEMSQYIHILVLFLFLQMLVDANIGINPRMVDLSLKINSHILYYIIHMIYEQSNLVTNYATYRGNTIQICLDEIYQLLKMHIYIFNH